MIKPVLLHLVLLLLLSEPWWQTLAAVSVHTTTLIHCGNLVDPDSNRRELENEAGDREGAVREGRQLLLNQRFLPADFHQSTFDELWRDWPEPLRTQAHSASAEERLALAFTRYGFTPRTDEPTKPLQFVVDEQGYWAMSCFACHGGKVAGTTIEGLPNSHIALETLYEDLRATKRRLKIPLNQMDIGALAVPMGTSRGTTNAVVFGIALMAYRDKDLNFLPFRLPRPTIIHHDMDTPAWWNVSKRNRLYIDGFVEKDPRALIPFVMDQRTRGKTLRGWESEFEKIYQYIESLTPPRYPYEIDEALAAKGQHLFAQNCAECHGTYDEHPTYPGRIVEIDVVGTDRVRLDALTEQDRLAYHESWYARYGESETTISPTGYQAPPLDGIWATAPYFHNGSVPTLRQVIVPGERPLIWKRSEHGYDTKRVGLEFESFTEIPNDASRPDLIREYFDTTRRGKSSSGHDFGAHLSESDVTALLEYLKSL